MPYRYLYIDDTNDKVEQGTINGLQDGNEIEIEFSLPNDWETQLRKLTDSLQNFNGLILDLRLNDNPYEKDKYAQYRGSTVAQELRTLAKENVIKNDFPIVLISANDNIEKSLDKTSLDLFDIRISKNTIGTEISYADFRNKLKWLADGYNFLNESEKTLPAILQMPENATIDFRFADHFNKLLEKPVVHVIARFLIKEVICRPTFLIDENYLAARLGVDKASNDWATLLETHLADCKYTGPFSNYYSRWWMSSVESFWQLKISKEISLRNAPSRKRVDLLIEKTGLNNLKPIPKDASSKSDSFWVVCKATHQPIDTIDGFTIANQENNYPWQESEYLSLGEALRPTKHFTVASIEKPRLQKLKELFEKNEQRIRK